MSDRNIGYLSSEQLLFLSPWRPVEMDTSHFEGREWECPHCATERMYYRALLRLEGGMQQFMIQCPSCDHLIVIQIDDTPDKSIATRFGGPHIETFLQFLDQRSTEDDYNE